MFSPTTQELEPPTNETENMELSSEALRLRQTISDFIAREQGKSSGERQEKPAWFLLARRTGENAETFSTEGGYGDFDKHIVEEVLNSFGIDRLKDVEFQDGDAQHELYWQKLTTNDPNVDIRAMKGQVLDPTTNQNHQVESYRFSIQRQK